MPRPARRLDEQGRQQCTRCQQRKAPDEFARAAHTANGRRSACKACLAAAERQRRRQQHLQQLAAQKKHQFF